jgi:hypothetical protein
MERVWKGMKCTSTTALTVVPSVQWHSECRNREHDGGITEANVLIIMADRLTTRCPLVQKEANKWKCDELLQNTLSFHLAV